MPSPFLLFASAIASASMSPAEAQRTIDNYPRWAISADRSAAAHVAVRVGLDGKATNCLVLNFAGSKKLATDICAILMKRRYKVGSDEAGKPIDSLFRTTVTMFVTPSNDEVKAVKAFKSPPDIVVPIQMPAEPRLSVTVLVDENGKIETCEAPSAQKNQTEFDPTIVATVCQQAVLQLQPRLFDTANQPTRYVTVLTSGSSPQ